MNLMQMLLDASDASAISQIGQKVGLDAASTRGLVGQLAPALSHGLKRNASSSQGLEGLARALSSGNHQRYLDQPAELAREETLTDGNAILGHLLGSKEESRALAAGASERSGVETGTIKKMLPLVAALAMGALSKKTAAGSALSGSQAVSSGGGASLLSSFLDADGDGAIADDVMNLAKKLF